MSNYIDYLRELAGQCADCSAFMIKLSAMPDCDQALELLACEFDSPEEFYAWARGHDPAHGAKETAPQAKDAAQTNISAVLPDGETALVLHPQAVQLDRECEALRERMLELYLEVRELEQSVISELLASYVLKVGVVEYQLFMLQCHNQRTRRKIEQIQAAFNHGRQPELDKIDAGLDEEFAHWQEKIQEQKDRLRDAQEREDQLLSKEETAKLRELYRQLVKRLHPDLNPDQGDLDRDLFLQMQKAYETGSLDGLKYVALYLEGLPPPAQSLPESPLEFRHQLKHRLTDRIDEISSQIETIKSSFPYTIIDLLYDPQWVQEAVTPIRLMLDEEEKRKKMLDSSLEEIMKLVSHG